MLTVQWQPPQYNGGAPVVNYTITVSPGLILLTTTTTSVVVVIPYNVMHNVSIVATNCNGSSSVVIETIAAIGKSCQFLVVTIQHMMSFTMLVVTGIYS